ncbi:MAG: type IX secretion system sortase PorU, partial [Flavobacteriales bacterium]|nr:type IX secretion system sortase PorU [Flavobacteriales bacterium]
TFEKGTPTAEGWLYFLQLTCERGLSMSGTQMHFRNMNAFAPSAVNRYQLDNALLVEGILDITDITQVKMQEFELDGSVASFKTENEELKEFVAYTGSNFLTPRAVGPVENQNLHAIDGADMIILSSPLLIAESEELADLHREEGMEVVVVSPMQVFNEFSSGNPDVTGIKMFMKHLYEKATSEDERIKYLTIMGDGSYTGNKSVNSINSYAVISYQSENSVSPTSSYISDDYFALLDDNEGESPGDKLDIGVGRIPAESAEEASDFINKVRIYMSGNTSSDGGAFCLGDENPSPYGPWRNNIVLVSDDQDGNGPANEVFHMTQSDEHADSIYQKYNDYNVIKIYMDAYQQVSTPGGERYPAAQEDIKQRVQQGALIVQYTGHGGEKGWAHERILDIPTIQDWTNLNRLPVFMTATCELARFDDPSFKSAGEILVMNGNGGAIGMLTTTRIVFSGPNQALAESFYEVVFEDEEYANLRLGDVARMTKNNDNVPNTSNKRNFSLLGDPALKLAYPKYDVFTTHINGEEFNAVPDTVRSLEEVTIQGFVGDSVGNLLAGFNGFVYPTVYDKRSDINVLNNDGGADYEFGLFKNIIYKGKASVVDGEFEFSFIVPKDINYNFGNGRISYYAVSGDNDAHGHSEAFVIGGSADQVELNDIGPDIALFMNDTTFVFGGVTDTDPILLAKVFDENGINTVGNGIGHDITATIDGQTSEQIVLNDFYEADLDTYASGEVRYQLSDLSEGSHTLKVKVWDVHNNSSESFTEFIVAADAQMALEHVLNYPNPFTTRTEFFFEHNQVCEVLDVRIQVFSVGGNLVKTIEQQVESRGFRSKGIVWDGKDDFGDKIGRGVYVYKVDVRTPTGLQAEKFEKLVILN